MPNVKLSLINAAWSAVSRMDNEADKLEAQAKYLREASKALYSELDPPVSKRTE
ncbi:hypothetical protein DB2_73 [Octadecabacter Antarctic DB virus 2]|nr:hypothetical protein DB2_73 [Octadecabacter Antarctic DB virus 2]